MHSLPLNTLDGADEAEDTDVHICSGAFVSPSASLSASMCVHRYLRKHPDTKKKKHTNDSAL